METKEQLEIIEKLKIWFTNNQGNIHQWSRNPLGIYLKNELIKAEHWKNCPRGNPRKGGRISYENKCKLNNPDY